MRKRFLVFTILVVSFAALAHAQQGTELTVTSIEPPSGQHLLLEQHAQGVQIYSCVVESGKSIWMFLGPEAELTNSEGRPAGKNSSGPSCKLLDGSKVKGSMICDEARARNGRHPLAAAEVVNHAGEGKLSQAE